MNVVRAELRKVVTTRLLLWYGAALLALLALALSTRIASDDRFRLEETSTQHSIFEHAGLVSVFAVLLGTVVVTTEYLHGTINQSLLVTPRRDRVLASKLAAALLVAILLALLADGLTLLIGTLWYAGRGVSLDLGADHVLAPLLGAVGASVIAAAIGTGFGALLRRQTAAVAVILVWLLIGEAAIGAIGNDARYSPGRALASVVVARVDGGDNTLGVWPAVLTGCAYAVLFVAAGAFAMIGSDVPSGGD